MRHHGQTAVAGQAHLQRVIRRGQLFQQFLLQNDDGVGGIQVHHFAEHTGEFERQRLSEIGDGEMRGGSRGVGTQPEISAARGDGGEQRAPRPAGLLEIAFGGAGQRVQAAYIQAQQVAPFGEATLRGGLARAQRQQMNDGAYGPPVLLADGGD